jgi:hypothetical protein
LFNVAQLQSDRIQQITSFPYSANGGVDKWSPDIPKFLYSYLELQLTGTLNKAGASANKGTAAPLGPLPLVKNVEFAVDGKVIKKAPLHALCLLGGAFLRRSPCAMSPTLFTADNGNQAFTASVYLDFQRLQTLLANGPKNPNELTGPELCDLRTTDWNNISMHVDWADQNSLVYGSTGYTTFNVDPTTKLDVIGHIDDRPFANDKTKQGFLLHKYLPKRISVPATQALLETKLPAGARDSYSHILIFQGTDDGAGALLPSTSVIAGTGKIQVWINNQSQKIFDTTWNRLIAMNQADYQNVLPAGYAIIDPLRISKQYASAWRADAMAGVQSVEILCDVTTSTNAFVEFHLGLLEPPQ